MGRGAFGINLPDPPDNLTEEEKARIRKIFDVMSIVGIIVCIIGFIVIYVS